MVYVIGAGISGATVAEQLASVYGVNVTIVEKRNHIGGNCFDYQNEIGVLVPKYGPHFFHTSNEQVFNYVSQFTAWVPYEHEVLSSIEGMLVPVPVNIDTVNAVFGKNIANETEMRAFLATIQEPVVEPRNSEESAISRVGRVLYEKLFRGYTRKQWEKDPSELDSSVLNRIPVRYDFESRYFTDRWQAMPKDGYTAIFEKMLRSPRISTRLGVDWFSFHQDVTDEDTVIFTGPVDRYFGHEFGHLEYRSLTFRHENRNVEYFQPKAQINYPGEEPYTRITEPKWATGQVHPQTTIIYEFPARDGEPFYPVPNQRNQELYEKYRLAASAEETRGRFFVGRLANYKYFNMDQAFEAALAFVDAHGQEIRLRGLQQRETK